MLQLIEEDEALGKRLKMVRARQEEEEEAEKERRKRRTAGRRRSQSARGEVGEKTARISLVLQGRRARKRSAMRGGAMHTCRTIRVWRNEEERQGGRRREAIKKAVV